MTHDQEQRAPRGYTSSPCPGCQQAGLRPKNEVCHKCRDLMQDGKTHREGIRKESDITLVRLGTEAESNPPFRNPSSRHYYTDSASQTLEALSNAFWTLVLMLCQQEQDTYNPDVPLFYNVLHGISLGKRLEVFRIRSDHLAATRALEALIREAIKLAYQDGLWRGSDLLQSLAAGEITTAQFESDRAGKRK